MKRRLLLFLLAFSRLFCYAQNYQCIQNGVSHYFINNINYLRGISIDSVHTLEDTTIYYPYRILRDFETYDTAAGGWLGEKVMQLPDGTFLFDNRWGDTVTVKTQAESGDSWLFYSDTTNNTYVATLTAIDTMTVLNTVDSVKIITIRSYHNGHNNINDPLNGYQIILSKTNGFAQIFDLYTFPYYSHSGEMYGDRYSQVGGTSQFDIVNYHNPTSLEMYDSLNVGDMFAGSYGAQLSCYESISYDHYDSIIARIVMDSFHINYAIHHSQYGYEYIYPYGASAPIYQYFSYEYYDTLRTDTSLIFLKYMPEQPVLGDDAYFYFPSDTTFCYTSPAYKSINRFIFEGCPFEADFKQGFLPTYDSSSCTTPCGSGDVGDVAPVTDIMYYALINGHSCNNIILPPLSVKIPLITDGLTIFPNPAGNKLNISASRNIQQVSIFNMLGETQYNQHCNSETVQLDISNLAAGMYFLKINGTTVQKFVKQ